MQMDVKGSVGFVLFISSVLCIDELVSVFVVALSSLLAASKECLGCRSGFTSTCRIT